jgi:DMSO/TMAO reductase YedYZ molybdopterin-dependent catalytic subunit
MQQPFAGRTVHGVPKYAREQAERPRLRIDGLVASAREFFLEDLDHLPRVRFLDAVPEESREFLPATNWSGIPLRNVVDLASPDPEAAWIRISSGPFATVIALADADKVLLCDRLDDSPIAMEQGGPWRLVRPDARYFTSVKWVDTVTLSAEEPDNSAERIIQARRHAREAKQDRDRAE